MQELDFNFVLEDKYIYVTKKGGKEAKEAKEVKSVKGKGIKNVQKESLIIKSPYLKVLKACHEFKSRYYLIVQLDMDLDVDERVEKFVKEIRNVDEISKEVLMQNSMAWYGKKWDIFTLDSMTRCPIDEQKGIFYMKILIEKENWELWKRVQTLEKLMESEPNNIFISLKTSFKGLRWSREVFSEEWYLEDFYVLEEEKEILDHLFQDGDDMSVAPSFSYPSEVFQEEIPQMEVVKEVPQEVAKEELPQEEVPQEMAQELPQEEPQEVPQELSQEEVSQEEMPQEVVQEMPQEMPNEMVQEMPNEVPQEVHQELASVEFASVKKKGDFRKKVEVTNSLADQRSARGSRDIFEGNQSSFYSSNGRATKVDSESVISALSTTSSKRVKKVFTLNGKLLR